jgi:hypothetical protein
MENIVLVTSIIKPPNTPLSYGVRSVYTSEQRFQQTKLTIQSINEKIPDAKIFIIECSDLNEDEINYFSQNSTYFVNLYNNVNLRNLMHSNSKSLCEGTMTISALDFLIQNNIQYDNLIKVSGRYYLSENFNINNFMNNDIVLKYIDNNTNNVFTGLYKIPKKYVENLNLFLKNSYNKMISFIGYEVLFSEFIQTLPGIKININPIGLKGYVSVSNYFYNG